ncbi:MAG: ABC transporter substrate-binding protein [Candidatus Electrothrix sp. YB6]
MRVTSLLKRHWRIFFVEAILLLITVGALIALNLDSNKIYIAVVFDQESSRETVKKALEIYADRINKYGGIKSKDAEGGSDGKHLEFIYREDGGSPEKAKQIAQELVQNKHDIAAVIGHFNNETTAAAAEIYGNAKKPLLVPLSAVDIDSQWVFQVSPSPGDYGLYAAHYIRQVLDKQLVTIVHSENKNDLDVVASFEKAFTALGGQIERKVSVGSTEEAGEDDGKDEELSEEQADKIIAGLQGRENNMLLLATQPEQTVSLVVALKRDGINIPVMSMNQNLGNAFEKYNEKYPGYFSDDIYAPAVLLFDNLQKELALVRKDYEQGDHAERISLEAMKTVLSAVFIKNALEAIPLNENREVSLHKLASFVEASDWFTKEHRVRSTKLIIGMYRHRHLIKAPINPMTVREGDLSEESDDKLLKIDNRLLYPADVVYSGVAVNKISNIDMVSLTYDLDFFVWFRYRHGVEHADDIEFLNSLEAVRLLDIVKETKRRKEEDIETPEGAMTASLVSETSFPEKEPRWSYRCYRVTGLFSTDDIKNYALGQQNLYVMFRNVRLNKFKLNYVSDYLNDNWGMYSRDKVKYADLEELKFDVIDNPQLELKYTFSYLAESEKTMLGAPEGIYASSDFSKFIAEYRVEPVLLSFRGLVSRVNSFLSKKAGNSEDQIDLPLMLICFALSFGLFLFAIYGDHTSASNKYSTWWWMLKLSLILFMLLFGELVVSQLLYNIKNSDWGGSHRSTIAAILHYWGMGIGIAGFLIPAYYIASAFDQFLWNPIEKRTGAESPAVLRLFVTVIIYTLAGLGIMYYVFDVRSNSLVATSGAVAVLFAVASKIDLSNILAGLGISFAKIFKLRDWVKIDGIEGKIIEMTPRSTKILTFDSSVVNIPNSKVAGSVIENFNRPGLPYRLIIHMELVPVYRFERVEKLLLDAVRSTDGVLDRPKPFVLFKGQGDSCQIYEVAFFIKDYARRAALWQAAWRRIWRHLEQAGIEMATPQREVFLPKASDEELHSPLTVLHNCGAFTGLADEQMDQLAEKAEWQRYRAGEMILSQEEDKERISVITEGVVALTGSDGQEKRLGVADVFGMDDLPEHTTATAVTDSEMLTVRKEDFRAVTEAAGAPV